ncbi:MAG: SAM-dependent methyltransferase [Alistipes sp.]|nr:SAM-dependent methyltransferase [Alistipes sp.]
MAEKGILYMIPCPISDSTEVFDVLPEANRRIMDSLDYFIVENVRSARRFLSKARVSRRIEELEFVELNEHTIAGAAVEAMVKPIEAGRSAGVISEAGVPGVADPGALVVEACHRRDIKVVPLVGPSSILLAMMASGLNGQSFAFVGYLPVKPPERAKALKSLERRAHVEQQSQIFIEAPYRNVKLAEQILAVCGADTRLTIACDITSPEQIIVTRSVAQWRKCGLPDIAKRPTIFIIG